MTRMIYDVSRKEEASLEKGFLDIVKTVYFTPENAHFYRTEGGFAALKAYLPADSGNDLPMLRAAGTAYIMSNAAPSLLALFPRRCSDVEQVLKGLV